MERPRLPIYGHSGRSASAWSSAALCADDDTLIPAFKTTPVSRRFDSSRLTSWCAYTDAVFHASRLNLAILAAVAPVMAALLPWPVDAALPATPALERSADNWTERAGDQRLDASVFRLIVPFRTQKDGGRWQTSNCGPATLGMLLDGFGIADQATDDLRIRAHTYQGTLGMRTGTGLDHVAHVGEDLGIRPHGLYTSDGAFHSWEITDIVAELRQGRPVMPLVRLYLVPGYEGLAPRWGHYILLTGLGPEGFYFSDSLKTDAVAGTSGLISERQLASAMAASHIPGQAVAFSGPRPLAVWQP